MCFAADCVLTAPTSVASYARWYQDTAVTITSVDRLVVTPGQPVLTHRGWVRASFVEPGDFLVAADVEAGPSAEVAWQTDPRPSVVVRSPVHGLWGDGGAAAADVEVKGRASGGLLSAGGPEPAAPSRTVWALLGVLTTPEAFGVASWTQAVTKVPALGRTWPRGEPTGRGSDLSASARARLGAAVLELPEPPEDRMPVWTRELLGVEAGLRLVRVEAVERSVLRGWVFNEACVSGALVAGGIVAGSSS